MATTQTKKTLFLLVYLTSFLYSFQSSLPLYVVSSFISQYISTTQLVGFIYSLAAIFTVVLTFFYPQLLKKFGNYSLTLTVMGAGTLSLLGLAFFSNPLFVIIAFVAYQTTSSIIFLNLDSFVEYFSDNTATGSIRTIFMTVLNIAVAIAPFIAGLMLTDHDYWKIFVAAAGVMTLSFFIIARNFRGYVDPHYLTNPFRSTLKIVAKNHDLHSIIFSHFLLSFFYVWMIIYTPLYMNIQMGIPMNKILGIIIPIALLPFIFFEVSLGRLADKKLGEKEILFVGFIIMAVSTAGLSFITTSSVIIWALILFAGRTGASMVEAMTESYFYKKVDVEDAHLITFMRTLRASAYIIGPIVGTVLLSFIDFRYLFIILGFLMLTSLPFVFEIKDTK